MKKPLKILLIKRGAMGDVLMTTPLIRQLKANLGDVEIDYCLSDSCAIVLANNPLINNIIKLEDKAFTFKGVIILIKFIWSIRKQYDYIFILGKNWLTNLLFKISGSTLVGFAREKISQYLLDKFIVYNSVLHYQSYYYLDLLTISGLGVANYNDIKMELNFTQEDIVIVDDLLNTYDLDEFIVVTNSGGNNQFEQSGIRMLPNNQIILLLKGLLAFNKVILLGSNIDYQNYVDYTDQLDNNKNLFNFAGKLSIAQSCYLLSKAIHFFVTDCGVMHVGLIAGIEDKMTCLFGPTNPAHILPVETKCNVVWNDEIIFDEHYQIYGKIMGRDKQYFQTLQINKVLSKSRQEKL